MWREKKKICLKQLNESSSSTINQINKNSRYFKKKKFFLNKLHVKNFYKNIDIQIVRLDEYLNNNSIEHINFMKIDTEGYEFDVLQGLGTMFNKHYSETSKILIFNKKGFLGVRKLRGF